MGWAEGVAAGTSLNRQRADEENQRRELDRLEAKSRADLWERGFTQTGTLLPKGRQALADTKTAIQFDEYSRLEEEQKQIKIDNQILRQTIVKNENTQTKRDTEKAFADYSATGESINIQNLFNTNAKARKLWADRGFVAVADIDFNEDREILASRGLTGDVSKHKKYLSKNFFKAFDGEKWRVVAASDMVAEMNLTKNMSSKDRESVDKARDDSAAAEKEINAAFGQPQAQDDSDIVSAPTQAQAQAQAQAQVRADLSASPDQTQADPNAIPASDQPQDPNAVPASDQPQDPNATSGQSINDSSAQSVEERREKLITDYVNLENAFGKGITPEAARLALEKTKSGIKNTEITQKLKREKQEETERSNKEREKIEWVKINMGRIKARNLTLSEKEKAGKYLDSLHADLEVLNTKYTKNGKIDFNLPGARKAYSQFYQKLDLVTGKLTPAEYKDISNYNSRSLLYKKAVKVTKEETGPIEGTWDTWFDNLTGINVTEAAQIKTAINYLSLVLTRELTGLSSNQKEYKRIMAALPSTSQDVDVIRGKLEMMLELEEEKRQGFTDRFGVDRASFLFDRSDKNMTKAMKRIKKFLGGPKFGSVEKIKLKSPKNLPTKVATLVKAKTKVELSNELFGDLNK